MPDDLTPVQFIGGPLDGQTQDLPIHVVEHIASASHPNGGISHHRYRLEWHSRDGKMIRLGICIDPGEDEVEIVDDLIQIPGFTPRKFARFEPETP